VRLVHSYSNMMCQPGCIVKFENIKKYTIFAP
jgi:hypothetical protein